MACGRTRYVLAGSPRQSHAPLSCMDEALNALGCCVCMDCAVGGCVDVCTVWQVVGSGSVTLDNTTTFHGLNSIKVSSGGGTNIVGVANRGLGNEGLVFTGGQECVVAAARLLILPTLPTSLHSSYCLRERGCAAPSCLAMTLSCN